MKPSDVLDAAAKLIEPEGAWTQGHYARGPDGAHADPLSLHAVCWCMSGAISRPQPQDIDVAYQWALRTTGGRFLSDWNDAPNRTQAEVVSALRQAADLARKAGE